VAEEPSGRASGAGSRSDLGADLVIPVLALLFALYFFSDISELNWEAKANGTIVGGILVVLVVLQIGRTGLRLARGQGRLGFDRLIEPRNKLPVRIAVVGLLAVFIATIEVTGTTLGLMGLMLTSMLVLGVRDWRYLIGISLGVPAAVYLAFIVFLHTKLPLGPAERLLGPVFGVGS
jgi:hypothetical protein